MQCQAPQRLDENGNVRQEYIDFMKKIPSPEERAKMTDDEILDWFISRRGGDRESIKKRLGDKYIEIIKKWYFKSMEPNKWEREIIYLTGIGMELEDWELLKREQKILEEADYNWNNLDLSLYKQILDIKDSYCLYELNDEGALLRS